MGTQHGVNFVDLLNQTGPGRVDRGLVQRLWIQIQHCYRLAYPSQRETADDQALRRAGRIQARLGWEPGILNGSGGKPKGMRCRPFQRLSAKHEAFVGESLAGMAQLLE